MTGHRYLHLAVTIVKDDDAFIQTQDSGDPKCTADIQVNIKLAEVFTSLYATQKSQTDNITAAPNQAVLPANFAKMYGGVLFFA